MKLMIPPTDLRDYLKSLGWSPLEEAFQQRLYVLENPRFPQRQMVFPMDEDAPDYLDSSELVVRKLSDLLQQEPEQIRAAALLAKDDVLRIRIASQAEFQGLPLGFAGNLLVATQKLLKSSACTVLRPRPHHPRLTLAEAVSLVDSCKLGHTESGSFVVKVSCPLEALDLQGTLDLGDGFTQYPFVRQVTFTLYKSIQALLDAIERDDLGRLIKSNRDGSAPLLSSNLCEAVGQLHDDGLRNSVEISFDWSALHPVADSHRKRLLRIQRDYFPRIEEVRRELRATEGDVDDTFVGTVERLDGEMSSQTGKRSGEVILAIFSHDGETIRVRTSLNEDQYALADAAHMAHGQYVVVCGRLRPGRQPRQLVQLTRFELF